MLSRHRERPSKSSNCTPHGRPWLVCAWRSQDITKLTPKPPSPTHGNISRHPAGKPWRQRSNGCRRHTQPASRSEIGRRTQSLAYALKAAFKPGAGLWQSKRLLDTLSPKGHRRSTNKLPKA